MLGGLTRTTSARGGNMKRKHGQESLPVKVITDQKKLAWLKTQIEKRKILNGTDNKFMRTVPSSE